MSELLTMQQMLSAEGIPFQVCDGRIFVRDRRRVLPFGPVLHDHRLTPKQADDLLGALGGWWVQWTSPIAGASSSEWYAIICRRFAEVDQHPSSSVRSKLRRGLKRCRVSRVSIDKFLEQGYEVFDAAVRNYGGSGVERLSRASFCAAVERERAFGHLRHYWMVHIDERAVAYAKTILHGTDEADYTSIKFDPEHLRHYPSYALIHEMNRYYLRDAGFSYVSDGQRSILHDTNFQEFLVKDLMFERHPLQLCIRYRRSVSAGMKLARLLRGALGRVSGSARAVIELDRCATEI